MGWYSYGGFAPYVSVAKRKRKAAKEVEKLKKKGQICQPIVLEGRSITNTFWGKAWCKNLESYSDYSNRLPRGRTYVRNGSVIDLKIEAGKITALVSGSSIYKVKILITKVVKNKWNKIVNECAGKIDSLIELLQGRLSKSVMEIIVDPKKGLFPAPKEIKLSCSCPDWADMCKHAAAVLYGVGVRFDDKPEELFMLRQADHVELISKANTKRLTKKIVKQKDKILEDSDLESLFGIDMGDDTSQKKIRSTKTILKAKKRKVSLDNSKEIIAKPNRMTKEAKKIEKKKLTANLKSVEVTEKAKRKKTLLKNKHKKTPLKR